MPRALRSFGPPFVRRLHLLRLLSAVALAVVAGRACAEQVVGVYYAASGKAEAAASVPAGQLTHLIYAFATMCGTHPTVPADAVKERARLCRRRSAFEILLPADAAARAEVEALAAHKRRNPALKLILSIGGWGMPLYPEMIRTPATRLRFVRSVTVFLRTHPEFDGIDIDWEYPGGGDNARPLLGESDRKAEAESFRALARDLRAALDGLGRRSGRSFQLTAAVAGYLRSVRGVDWGRTQGYFNYLFVMTYDFTPEKAFQFRGDYSGGGGSPGHHSNLHASAATGGYGADAMVRNLAAVGVPRGKMVIGAAFYAREWKEVDWSGGTFPAATPKGAFVGTVPYKALKGQEGLREGYDEAAGAAYLAGDGRFLSYDDRRSICAKGEWAVRNGLAGIFAWEASQDDGSLVQAMRDSVDGRCRGG
jgi:chitinase